MSENIYDLSVWPRDQEPNKPYWMPDPATAEDGEKLNRYLDLHKHFQEALNQIPSEYGEKGRICRLSNIVPIGETPEGDHVCLIMQGMVHGNTFHGGCYPVVCDPLGLDELAQDLEDTEREFREPIEKLFKPLTE
jgi:hypothetical protein